MALGRLDRALHHRKFGDARRRDAVRPRDQHGDVEMILEQRCRLRSRARRGRRSGSRLRSSRLTNGISGSGSAAAASSAAIFGPALAASVDQPAVSRMLTKAMRGALARDLGEQRRLLGAADGERLAARRGSCGSARARRGRAGARSRPPRRGSRAGPRRASSGMVSSQEQTRMVRFSAISAPA